MSKLARKPPSPPKPKITRPLAQQPSDDSRPMTRKMMQALTQLIEESDGKLTRAQFARDIGRRPNEMVEWLGCWRSSPTSESLLKMFAWALKHDRHFAKRLLS